MKPFLRALARKRAKQRCEYCRLHEDDLPFVAFHVEHILPKKHGGTDNPKRIAWSCQHCNLAKSSNLSGRDSVTDRIVVLFIRAASVGVGTSPGTVLGWSASRPAVGQRLRC